MSQNWLENLKPGDKVIVRGHDYRGESYSIDSVKNITPKRGDIKLEKTYAVFSKKGRHYGSRLSRKYYELIEPTIENLEKMKEETNKQTIKWILYFLNERRNNPAVIDLLMPYREQFVEIYEKVKKQEGKE